MLETILSSPFLWGGIGGFLAFLFKFNGEWMEEMDRDETVKFWTFFQKKILNLLTLTLGGAIIVYAISISSAAPIWQIIVGGSGVKMLSKFINQ